MAHPTVSLKSNESTLSWKTTANGHKVSGGYAGQGSESGKWYSGLTGSHDFQLEPGTHTTVWYQPVVDGKRGAKRYMVMTTSAPVPPAPTLLTGWSSVNIARATKFAGKPKATRGPFYSTLPTTYSPTAPRMSPDAHTRFVSFTNVTPSLESYCKSVPDTDTVCLIWLHEVENGKSGTYEGVTKDYTGNGAAYVSDYVKIYNRVKAANPKVQMGMVSASWAYRPNQADKSILAGAFLPPADKVDFYGVDTYQEGTVNLQPLQSHPKFQNWFNLVKDRGRPIGLTEYAHQFLDVVSQDPFQTKEQAPGESAARAKTIAADWAWIKSTGLFTFWLYWYYSDDKNGDPTYRTREFTDQGSIDAWNAVVNENA